MDVWGEVCITPLCSCSCLSFSKGHCFSFSVFTACTVIPKVSGDEGKMATETRGNKVFQGISRHQAFGEYYVMCISWTLISSRRNGFEFKMWLQDASCSVTVLTSVHTIFNVIPIDQYSPSLSSPSCINPLPQEKELTHMFYS